MTLAKKPLEPDTTEVEVPVQKPGSVQFGIGQISNPTPRRLKQVLTALRYFAVSLIGAVSATDLFTGYQSKVISFCLTIFIFLLGAIELGTGVQTEEKK